MIKAKGKKETPASGEPHWSRIRLLAIKLRSISFLIGVQATDEDPPLDMEEVSWGTGLLLEEIARDMRDISDDMELGSVRRAEKRATKGGRRP